MSEAELVRRLTAHVECSAHLPMGAETAGYVIRILAPAIVKIIREERSEERRAKVSRECQA